MKPKFKIGDEVIYWWPIDNDHYNNYKHWNGSVGTITKVGKSQVGIDDLPSLSYFIKWTSTINPGGTLKDSFNGSILLKKENGFVKALKIWRKLQ
jgi:hypothetical protein